MQAQFDLYGITSVGGPELNGSIFKFSPDTDSFAVLYGFETGHPGAFPWSGRLTRAANGKWYGMTTQIGNYLTGVIFEYDPKTNAYTKKHVFDGYNGALPTGNLTLAGNGKLYGLTRLGGNSEAGVLFEFDPAIGVYTKKFDFDGPNGHTAPGSLVRATNGKLYGMTIYGGKNDIGTLFEYDPESNIFLKKYDFGGPGGHFPAGSLIQATNGKLYGMTRDGGNNGRGAIFEFDPETGIYTNRFDFDSQNGVFPEGSLLQASNGKLYGMTRIGGNSNLGVLFEFDPVNNVFAKKFSFNTTSGSSPIGDLVELPNKKLYGMTPEGGSADKGVLFEFDPYTEIYIKKLDFDGTNGASPQGSLTQVYKGKLYGMTNKGGSVDQGVLFEYVPGKNLFTKKFDFDLVHGAEASGSLLLASNGKMYGLTRRGGAGNFGVLFEFDPVTNNYENKVDFDGANGDFPTSSLIEAVNGKLYGMTYQGGSAGAGVLFEFDPVSNTFTKKIDFTGSNGANPYGSLMKASNGKLYGLTSRGGNSFNGVLFEFDPVTNLYVKKYNFDFSKGRYPQGNLIQASNGKLYGLTYEGGSNNLGVVFEYNIATNTYTKKADFSQATGTNPYGSLTEAPNGKFYGMTFLGGFGGGLFEFDPATNALVQKVALGGALGGLPFGSLTLAPNGKLYGMTSSKGASGYYGTLFDYDPNSGVYTVLHDFSVTDGGNPYGDLIIVPTSPGQKTPAGSTTRFHSTYAGDLPELDLFPNPAHGAVSIRLRGAADLAVFDPMGRLVWQRHVENPGRSTVHFDVSELDAGVYWVEARADNSVTGKRLVVVQ